MHIAPVIKFNNVRYILIMCIQSCGSTDLLTTAKNVDGSFKFKVFIVTTTLMMPEQA